MISFYHTFKVLFNFRNQQNILFLFYEDMQKDLRGIINQVCNFIGKQFTDKQVVHIHLGGNNAQLKTLNINIINKDVNIHNLRSC